MFSSLIQIVFGKFSSLFSYLSPFYDIIKYVAAPKLVTDGKKNGDGLSNTKSASHSEPSSAPTSASSSSTNLAISTTSASDVNTDDTDDFGSDLFSKPSTYNDFKASSKTLRSCAVSEFDYDFTSPFSWDFQHLVLANQLNANNPSLPNNNGATNKQHINKNGAINENISGVPSSFTHPKVIDVHDVSNVGDNENSSANLGTSSSNNANGNAAVPTTLLFNGNGPQFNLNPLENYNNQNLDNQEANQILSQFSASFQNQLKRNELYQIYQNQNQNYHDHDHDHEDHGDHREAAKIVEARQRADLANASSQSHIHADVDKDAHISEDEAEFSDDDYEDYLHGDYQEQTASSSQPQLLHSYAQPNHNLVSYHFDSDNEDDDDDRDAVPLDEELMLSFLRRSNDNTLSVYYMNSDLSEGNTVSPHTGTSDSVSDSSPVEHPNLLKREIDSEMIHENRNETHKMNSNIIIHDKKYSIATDAKTINPASENNVEPKKKYRKLAFSSKPSVSLNSKENSSVTSNNASSDGNNTVPSTSELKLKQNSDDQLQSRPDKLYVCPICQTTFKVKGYLTRHRKKHFASKPFQCPYFDPSIDYDENDDINHSHSGDEECASPGGSHDESKSKVPRCHPTGGFSRRDTFKTHLKALHFVYPTGTKSGDRSDKKGRCAACFKEFKTNKEWLESHVMTNQCEGMITKYK